MTFATSGMKNIHRSKVWTDDHPPMKNNIAIMVQLVPFVVRWEVSFSQDCSWTLAIAQNVQIVFQVNVLCWSRLQMCKTPAILF